MASRWFQVGVSGAKICFDAKPLRSVSRKRTKEIIATERHLYLDFDIDGEAHLTSLRVSDAIPTLTAFISRSPGKYQSLWRVDGFTLGQQGSTLELFAIAFGRDPACTDFNRIVGVPGFLNYKCDPAYPVTVEYRSDSTGNPDGFRPDIATANAILWSRAITARKHSPNHANSEHDWVRLGHELAHWKDAEKFVPTLALRRADIASCLLLRTAGRCGNRPKGSVSRVSRWTILSRCLNLAVASRFPPHFAPLVHARLRSQRRGYCLGKDFDFTNSKRRNNATT